MIPSNKDNNANAATDIILVVVVLGAVGFGIWYLLSSGKAAEFIISIAEALVVSVGVIAGAATGYLWNLGKDIGTATNPFDEDSEFSKFANKFNPVNAYKENKKKKGRKWYTLYLW